MARKPITHNLRFPEKMQEKSRSLHGLLSKLFWQIIMDNNITVNRYDHLMTQYVKDPANGVAATAREQTTERGNMNKAFCKSIISWKVFCKSFRFFRWRKITLTLTAEHWDGKITHHSVDADLTTYNDEDWDRQTYAGQLGFDRDGNIIDPNQPDPLANIAPWHPTPTDKEEE